VSNLNRCFSEKIEVLEQTSYRSIHDKFLIRGLPVIVGDSALDLDTTKSLQQFIDDVSQNMTEIIQQEACDLETNLMMYSYASVNGAFEVLRKMLKKTRELEPWFISFRNCKFKAVE